ncbi:dynein regulatory complex subunit 2 [Mastacembelus armatus]|uniref:dynein regulatory complex subunit 2 n=1 Tax=Mastacembelus armatus TaxID=205130 RepID=UPI000E45562E|nr:dynein regulatory complex subunit 2 [Mastacembelus armatus]
MPKKAKKGGGGKGGGKTEEERLVYLQQRAQAEEEMAKKKEEILTLFLKDKLQKEQKNTALNQLKLNEGWRTILRQTRAAELRKDISVVSQTFERQLDGLCSVVKTLEGDLQEAERQSAQVRRVHLQHLERLWAQQEKRLKFLLQQWENGLQHLSSRFSCERQQMLARSQQLRADLDDSMFSVAQQQEVLMTEISRLYNKSIRLYQSAHEDRRAMLVLKSKEKLKAKTLQKNEAQQICHQSTKDLDTLVGKNQNNMRIEDKTVKGINEMQDYIVKTRAKMNSSKIENKAVEQDMTAAKNQVREKTQQLRHRLTQEEAAARKRLTELTIQSDSASKKLQATISKGERVLRVAEMCQKLESEHENIFTSSSTQDNPRQEGSAAETEQPEQETPEFPELQPLMWRLNVALLHRGALKKHRADLSQENQQLRLLLRQHLDAMTVSDAHLDARHALLSVYQAPIRTTAVPPDTERRHTVIEAVHVVKHSL